MRQSREGRALRQFITLSPVKSAGRNYLGRITVFHRGGGAKRLQRRMDLKRRTSSMLSSMVGIVERIEYDPNRSSRIAPVRWIDDNNTMNMNPSGEESAQPLKILEPSTTLRGFFLFSYLTAGYPRREKKIDSPGRMAAYYVVGGPPTITTYYYNYKKTCKCKDVFSYYYPNQKGEIAFFGSFLLSPGKKASSFFDPQPNNNIKNTFSLCEVPNTTNSGATRINPISWHSFSWRKTTSCLLFGAAENENNNNKSKRNNRSSIFPAKTIVEGPKKKDGAYNKVDRAPVV